MFQNISWTTTIKKIWKTTLSTGLGAFFYKNTPLSYIIPTLHLRPSNSTLFLYTTKQNLKLTELIIYLTISIQTANK